MSTLTTTIRQPMGISPGPPPARGAAAAAVTAGLTPADIVRIFKQRIFMILLIGVLGSGATVGTTIAVGRYFPLWTAEALISVESPTPANPFDPWGGRIDRDTVERNLMDQASRMKDPALLRDVLTAPEIRNDTQWFKQFDEDVDEALEELDENLLASPMRGTSLLRVAMATRDPKDGPKIVNKVVDLYMERVANVSRSYFADSARKFEQEVRQKEQEVDNYNDRIAELEREAKIPAMSSGAPTVTVRLQSLQREVVDKESELELLRARYYAYRDMSPQQLQSSADLVQRVEMDPKIAALDRHIRDLTEERERMSLRFGPKHVEIREVERQIAVAQEELNSKRQTRLREEHSSLLQQYEMAYRSAQQAVVELQNAVAEATQLQLDLDSKLQTYQTLVQKRDKVERERERYADAHAQYLMVARTDEPVRITRLRRATVPLEPSRPRPKLWIPVGVFMSFLLGAGLALGLNLLDTGLRTPRDVIRHASLPLLGTVPVLDDEEASVEDIETAARLAPNSLVAESFRQIRANLLFSAPMEQQRTVLIASASPSEGKTCVAINLGVTLAQGGRRVLLIDANFRRASLHKAFNTTNGRGLSNLLVGQGALSDCVRHTELPNLDVLVAGPCPPNPAELLASNYLRAVLADAVGQYDQVILDGPPVLLVSDAATLSALVDGVILVCRARTHRGMVQRAKSQLTLVNSRVIGAVLNAVETTRGGYFRKYYREFYDYMEPQEEEQEPAREREELEALPSSRDGQADAFSAQSQQADSAERTIDETRGSQTDALSEDSPGPDASSRGESPGQGG